MDKEGKKSQIFTIHSLKRWAGGGKETFKKSEDALETKEGNEE